uniref:Uncharacterized protein n=1 Tax=Aegilops tauschii subsp. strangulata TaxID=200361 RepID=A0A453N3I3_AEGTS
TASSFLTGVCRLQPLGMEAVAERAKSTALSKYPSARAVDVAIRQAAPEHLLLAGTSDRILLAAVKTTSFHHAGYGWLELGRVDLATACFEKITLLVFPAAAEEERSILLDLDLARRPTRTIRPSPSRCFSRMPESSSLLF